MLVTHYLLYPVKNNNKQIGQVIEQNSLELV